MIQRKERGWPGHFILGRRCLFRRNTLLTDVDNDRHIVVSTVGNMLSRSAFAGTGAGVVEAVGAGYYYETLAFVGQHEGPYVEAAAARQVFVDRPHTIPTMHEGVSNDADAMHEDVVDAITRDFHRLWETANARTE